MFKLHHQLKNDTRKILSLEHSDILLMDDCNYPWIILVPRVDKIEWSDLHRDKQMAINDEINIVAKFLQDNFITDKINIATLGNMVSQMHWHIVVRSKDDIAWPKPIWGVAESKSYTTSQFLDIQDKFKDFVSKYATDNI